MRAFIIALLLCLGVAYADKPIAWSTTFASAPKAEKVMYLDAGGVIHLPPGATAESVARRVFEVYGATSVKAVKFDCADCKR